MAQIPQSRRMSAESGQDGPGSTVISIGYQGRCLEDFLALLVECAIEVLVDVRLTPISRKKGFSKKALSEALAERGISYRHEPSLGNPRENREGFRNGTSAARRRYEHLLSNDSREAFESVLVLIENQRVALLCFELEHAECHRSVITSNIQRHNSTIEIRTV